MLEDSSTLSCILVLTVIGFFILYVQPRPKGTAVQTGHVKKDALSDEIGRFTRNCNSKVNSE